MSIKWHAYFCNPLTVLGTHRPLKTALKYKQALSPFFSKQKKKNTNDCTVFCHSFNKRLYTYPNCYYKQVCKTYRSKDHNFKACKKPATSTNKGAL